MRLIYHPVAEAELIEAAQFYERRVPTLGAQFPEATDRAIHVIKDAPERRSIIEADARRYLMPRFPYAIYYRALSDQLRILAFQHTIAVTRTTGAPVSLTEPRSLGRFSNKFAFGCLRFGSSVFIEAFSLATSSMHGRQGADRHALEACAPISVAVLGGNFRESL
jgi:toxin ParE1/3/4